METNLTLNVAISILSVFAGILNAFQILTLKRPKTEANKYFAFYFLTIGFIIFFLLMVDIDLSIFAIMLVPFFTTSVLFIAPLLWISLNKLVSPEKKIPIKRHLLLGIIIGAIALLLEIGIWFFREDKALLRYLGDLLSFVVLSGITVVFIVQNGIYIYLSYKTYLRHQKKIREVFSYQETVDLKWVRALIIGYTVFVLGLIATNIIASSWSDILYHTVMLGYILYTGYSVLKQAPIPVERTKGVFEEPQKVETVSKKRLPTFEMNEILFVELKESLIHLFSNDKPYIDQELTIYRLAKSLNTNSKYLSLIINNEFNESFVHFVNRYRVEEAKVLLLDKDNKNFTLEAIGHYAGFKSKSSFNRAFNQYTGVTPSV
ncbi:MAG: AraC family transcriptional regulator, partial [Crocinitomicaceae bacterium]|nr:AraC family transcriptional regulator [Crocinitomicaceae bacterium]